MSKDMLGPFLRALGKVPDRHLGLVLDILHKLASERGEFMREKLSNALRATQPDVPIEHVPAEYRQFFDELPEEDRAWVLANPRTAIPLFVKAVSAAHIESLPLVFVTETIVPAHDEFRVSEKFRDGETIDGVRIHSVRGHPQDVKVLMERIEPATPEAVIRFHTSNTKTTCARILDSFADLADITMGQLWHILKESEDKDLLAGYRRRSNNACIRGGDSEIYYLSVHYVPGEGWHIWIGPRRRFSSPPGKYDRFLTR
jgi:hypothetical protein